MTLHSEKRDTDLSSTGLPTVWVLVDDRPGNTTQSIGLAQMLGWPFTVKELYFTPVARTSKSFLGPSKTTQLELDKQRSAELAPPWPQVIIATGRRSAPIARWIKQQSHGAVRLIQLGRKGGHVAALFDGVISCSYFHLPPDPRRIEIAAPLTRISADQLQQTAQHWHTLVAGASHPYIMVLVGGATKRHRFDPTIAQRLGEDLRAFAKTAGGSLFVTTSRRTTSAASAALKSALGNGVYLHEWQPGAAENNPYLAFLALADILIVTGESESMLAEATVTGKPCYIYPLPETVPPRKKTWRKRLKRRLKDIVVAQWRQQTKSAASTSLRFRFCRWLIANGFVRPRRDLHELHQALIRRGSASLFGTPFPSREHPPPREIDEIVLKVKALLGFEKDPVGNI